MTRERRKKRRKKSSRASLSFADPGIVCDLSVLHSLRALFIISTHFQQMRAALLFHIQRRGTAIHIPAVGYCGRRISGTNTHTLTSPTARNVFFILTSTFTVRSLLFSHQILSLLFNCVSFGSRSFPRGSAEEKKEEKKGHLVLLIVTRDLSRFSR